MEGVLLIGGIDPRGRDLVLMGAIARSIIRTNEIATDFVATQGWVDAHGKNPRPIDMRQSLASTMDPRLFPERRKA